MGKPLMLMSPKSTSLFPSPRPPRPPFGIWDHSGIMTLAWDCPGCQLPVRQSGDAPPRLQPALELLLLQLFRAREVNERN